MKFDKIFDWVFLLTVTATCDGVISTNNTHFVNPQYPSTYSTAGMCMATLEPPSGVSTAWQMKKNFKKSLKHEKKGRIFNFIN